VLNGLLGSGLGGGGVLTMSENWPRDGLNLLSALLGREDVEEVRECAGGVPDKETLVERGAILLKVVAFFDFAK
jgi:hypothetical protein